MFLYVVASLQMVAQTPRQDIQRLMTVAERNYPLLRSKSFDVLSAEKQVDIMKSSVIPSLDAAYQVGYGTHNGIAGLYNPQYLMALSAPPSAENSASGVFGSAASLLLNWQPVTFGQRKSQVDYARAGTDVARADEKNAIFNHQARVIDVYLDALTANEIVKVNEDNLKRCEANLTQVSSLVNSGIKPGVDTALFKSELSKARVDLLNSRKYQDQYRILLSQLLATDSVIIFTGKPFFNSLPSYGNDTQGIPHPLVSLYESNVAAGISHRNMLSKTTMPTLGFWGNTYVRGSGLHYDGTIKSTDGLGFQRYNYGVGLQLSMPLLQGLRVKPQLERDELLVRSETEKLNEVKLRLSKQQEIADTLLNNAFAVARESPMFLESAQYSYRAIGSRYGSGLATYADLIQTQYTLLRAETEQKLYYMAVWKAWLYKAAVAGDLNLFINRIN